MLFPDEDPRIEGAKHIWRYHWRDGVDALEVVAWTAGLALVGTGLVWLASHV